jgi:hypothetical protein
MLAVRTGAGERLDPEIEEVLSELLRFCPEREEVIRARIGEYAAAGLEADDIRRAVGEEVEGMMPDVIRERQARISDIMKNKNRDAIVPATPYEAKLIEELNKVDATAEEASASKKRIEMLQAKNVVAEVELGRAQVELDKAKAAAAEWEAGTDGGKKKFGMFAFLRHFFGKFFGGCLRPFPLWLRGFADV